MSKRFGRNQRRRARESIAALTARAGELEKGMAMDRGLIRQQSARLAEADAFAREVGAIVGREAVIAGEPVMMDLRWPRRSAMGPRLVPSKSLGPIDFETPLPSVVSIQYETLRLLEVDCVADRISRTMHVRVTMDDKTIGYGLTEAALIQMTDREIESRVAPEIARMLAAALKRGRTS